MMMMMMVIIIIIIIGCYARPISVNHVHETCMIIKTTHMKYFMYYVFLIHIHIELSIDHVHCVFTY